MSDKRISFTISDKAHKALRHLAADRESSQQAVIEDLILTAGAKWVAEQADAGHGVDDLFAEALAHAKAARRADEVSNGDARP